MTRFLLVIALATSIEAAPNELERRLLTRHNQERARMGVPPLIWDDALARNAASWARNLARSGRLEHAQTEAEGENLWSGSKASFTPEEMVDAWIAERADYKPGRFPDVSKSGDWSSVGHYTQLIWAKTTRLGCAVASGSEDDVLVCRYGPPGNVEGESPMAPAQTRVEPAQPRVAPAPAAVAPAIGGMVERLLQRHNQERARMRVPLLQWDEGLAQRAAAWAQQLARSGRFEHENANSDGENLWTGTKSRFAPEEMVDSWIREGADYRPGRFPDVAKSGNWANVGHYTQLIWSGTTHLGCAVATGTRNDVLVCRYSPAGNMQGEFVVAPR